jgi:outer membrane protein TolC
MNPRGWTRAALGLWLCSAACAPPVAQLGPREAVDVWRRASAAPDAPPPERRAGLDAAQLVALALERDPALQALRAEVAALDAGVATERARGGLELRLSQFRVDDVRADEAGVELALRARPERPREVPARVAAARLEVDAARAELREAELALVATVRRLHAELRLADEQAKVSEQEATLRDRERALSQARLDAGAGTSLDLALAAMARAELAAEAREPDADRVEAAQTLRQHIGLPASAPLELVGSPGGTDRFDAASLDPEALVAEALAQHPTLHYASALLAEASVERWRSRADPWPWLSFVQAEYDASPRPPTTSGPKPLKLGFALGVDIPLWSWTGASTRAARARELHRRLLFDASALRVASGVLAAADRVTSARARVVDIETLLLPAADAVEAEADKARAQGALDPLRALQIQTSRLRARRLAAEARHELALAIIALDEALARKP